ncbi:unnamed protein product (macronuclear) [Paramecium tetraurelia]|uniref:Uncharacterized protein n=1 Tax=Paramecium tetraurelia TaxID=5888 RepID=A0D107_PARTE|nr:uncharacterized protein GSPATT00012276001 [Paramecium tetraurelia]CAK76724.1 unnamed protein product [Paramecium tetraurelia]|eukprot:XP_001444121.1 hypothetical protein (macronuclear) [Paramecium tetraurelia strain d4-2]
MRPSFLFITLLNLVYGINYSIRGQSNLLDLDPTNDDLQINEGFREAADLIFGTLYQYLPYIVLALTFIYFANKFFPTRQPKKILKKLPIQKR